MHWSITTFCQGPIGHFCVATTTTAPGPQSANIVKKSNARLELLRRVASFSPPLEDLKKIYFLFIRSLLEQSATVWHSSLTEENSNDLERVQKSAVRIMLGNSYSGYKKSLNILQIDSLRDRREQLCL